MQHTPSISNTLRVLPDSSCLACNCSACIAVVSEQEHVFESDAPDADAGSGAPKRKFMATFPYPYMNGRLHLGHAFTLTKADFAANFHRLQVQIDCCMALHPPAQVLKAPVYP